MIRNLACRVFSIVVLVALSVAALFKPWVNLDNGWIPLVGGFGNTDFLNNGVVSILLGMGIIGATLFSIYLLIRRVSVVDYVSAATLFLLLIAANPSFIHFNTIYILLLSLVWVQLCIVELQIFTAFFILSGATLFYAPAIWLVPLILLLIPFNGSPDSLKSFVKAFAGFITPHLYLLVFRWIKFDDAGVYLMQYWESITNIHLFETHWSFPRLFLALCILYLVMKSSHHLWSTSMGKLPQALLKMQVFLLAILLPMLICFSTEITPLFVIMAYPLSILFSFYFKSYHNAKRTTAEYILLIMAIIINSLSYII
jgi:hypothetical protein